MQAMAMKQYADINLESDKSLAVTLEWKDNINYRFKKGLDKLQLCGPTLRRFILMQIQTSRVWILCILSRKENLRIPWTNFTSILVQ